MPLGVQALFIFNSVMKYTLFVLAILALFLSSCKKPDDSFSGAKVLTASNLVANYTETYTYNGDGNLITIQRVPGNRTEYTYTGDTVLVQEFSAGSVLITGMRYILSGAYTDTSYGLVQAQNNSYRYAYDGNGQLTQLKSYGFGALANTADYALSNKNVTSITYTYPNNTRNYVYFAYVNTVTNTIGNQNFGKGFLGIGTLHSPVTRVSINNNGDTTDVIQYKYGVSSANIVSMVSYNRAGILVDSMTYTY